jgi:hypothetical protein
MNYYKTCVIDDICWHHAGRAFLLDATFLQGRYVNRVASGGEERATPQCVLCNPGSSTMVLSQGADAVPRGHELASRWSGGDLQ